MLRAGDLLDVKGYSFGDHLTTGRKYVVTKVEECPEGICGGIMFWVINDLGQEIMPITTRFNRVKK